MTDARYLDEIETGLLERPYLEFVEYHGVLDEPLLERAVALMAHRYPVLRGRIVRDGTGFLLEAPPDGVLSFRGVQGGVDALAEVAEEPWDASNGAVAVIHVHDDGHGYVAIRTDHAVVDGTSLVAMLDYLWQAYTDLVHGRSRLPEPGTGLPEGPYKLMMRPGGIRRLDAVSPVSTRLFGPPVNNRIGLTREETGGLAALARREDTSVHALVCGAVLVAQRSLGARSTADKMACWTFVDLRTRVVPPVGATQTTYFIALQKAEVAVSPDSDPARIGRCVKDSLDESLSAGDAFAGSLFRDIPGWIDSTIEPRLSVVAVTNMGAMTAFPEPEELCLTGFGALPPGSMSVPFPIFRVYTYKGTMNVFSSHPRERFDDGEVSLLVRRTAAALRSLAAS